MHFCQVCLYSSSYGQQILEDFGQCQWVPGEGPGRGGGGVMVRSTKVKFLCQDRDKEFLDCAIASTIFDCAIVRGS